ncbi:MAG: sigma-70 family RNA polymerase sigma factor [Clostridium sp.]
MGDYIKNLKNNKKNSMYEIIDIYDPLIRAIACKILGQTSNVDECVNDVYLSIWINRDKFYGDESNFKKWCGTIAKYKAIDYYRKNKRSKEEPLSNHENLKTLLLEDEILEKELIIDLKKALGKLGNTDEKIFELKYVLGYKGEEIANELQMSKEAINSRIFRGKKRLRVILENLL